MNTRIPALGLLISAALAASPASVLATQSSWLRVEASQDTLRQVVDTRSPVIDYGSFQWLALDENAAQSLRNAGLKVTTFENPFVLDLGGQRFDPANLPQSTHSASATTADWRLVQFRGPVKPEWLTRLRDSGVTPVQYIHPFAYVVWSDGNALGRAMAQEEVRWSGEFLPTYRVQPGQRNLDSVRRPTMALFGRHGDPLALTSAVNALGVTIQSRTRLDTHFDVVQLDAPGDRYLDLASIPGVFAVQDIPPETRPRGEMSNQAIVGNYGPAPGYTIVPGYQTWLDTLGYDGSGVVVAVVDGGVRSTHTDLASRMVPCVASGDTPSSCSTSNDSHGTHVAGAIAGTGASGTLLSGFLRGKGVAPGANIVQQRYNSFIGGGPGSMIADGMLKIYKESSLSGAVLTNNSWGPTGSPQGYDIPTQQIDMVIRDADPDEPGNQQVLNVWSIMNGGGDSSGACAPSSLGSPDEAKNLFAVGSTSLQSSSGVQLSGIFDVSSNSAHGNACDGRRVPNIVAPGCNTDSTNSSSDTSFGFKCGTSMASPVVSGASAIFVEKYRAEHADVTPSPAMIKAALTVVAKDLEGFRDADGRLMGHRPDRFQGYGRLDLEAAVNSDEVVFMLDQSELLTETGAAWTLNVAPADPALPVRIMLVWSDAKGHGLGGSTPAWVNDLDLSVDTGGESYLGNAIGSDGWSATGGSADAMNNIEAIYLRPDQIGASIDIEVLAANLAGDAINPWTPGAPAQDFALVCRNCLEAPLGSSDLGLSLSASPTPAIPGETLQIIASIDNFGADEPSGASLSLTLPDTLEFVSGQLQSGSGLWTCSAVASAVACQMNLGTMAVTPLASVLQITTQFVSSNGDGSPLEISGTISAAQFVDSQPDNNDAS
ncbi:S8 family serine peptidase, partial [Dokdonella sp.]|uniref:S8 family serine peptidase n=1 Tax=Dokdonella sp. TaxID=2291710 RepID=UPI003C660844